MQAVRVKFYQEIGHFKMPYTVGSSRISYPLPPFMTVSGMIHNLCNWKIYHPLMISVQRSSGVIQDSIRLGYIGGHKSSKITNDFNYDRWEFIEGKEGGYIGYNRLVMNEQIIADANYIVHILPESEKDIDDIYNSLLYPRIFPALGRYDDTIRIDNVEIVEVSDDVAERELVNEMYINANNADCFGTVYKVTKKYDIVRKQRVAEKVICFHLEAGNKVIARVDKDGFIVDFN